MSRKETRMNRPYTITDQQYLKDMASVGVPATRIQLSPELEAGFKAAVAAFKACGLKVVGK